VNKRWIDVDLQVLLRTYLENFVEVLQWFVCGTTNYHICFSQDSHRTRYDNSTVILPRRQ